ncbi:MAG: hypothetical protein RLZZ230_164 [Candidatus Parcubacteria bacterium]|jgi:hypothetical protein
MLYYLFSSKQNIYMEKTNLYSVSIPPMIKALENLSGLLDKLVAHADSKQQSWQQPKMQENALLNSTLISDQFPFITQVRIACDNAKGAAARLSEIEVPKYEDNETTVDELKARIQKTIAFVKSVKPEKIIGNEDVLISLMYWEGKSLNGFEYVTEYLLPNFYFHVTTAYSILRANGVNVGKSDFVGELPLK